MTDQLLDAIVAPLAAISGVAAVALGGSRAGGVAGPSSDYDLGLYFRRDAPLDTARLRERVRRFVDDPRPPR